MPRICTPPWSGPCRSQPLLKERAGFLGRRPTTAPTAQHFSSVPRGKSLTAFAERAPRFLGRCPYRSQSLLKERARFLGRCHDRSQSMLKERARFPESVPPSLTAFAARAPHSRDGKACEFTTSACLKHSRDGRACVSITSACLQHFRDGKPCVFTTSVCLKHSQDVKDCVLTTSA